MYNDLCSQPPCEVGLWKQRSKGGKAPVLPHWQKKKDTYIKFACVSEQWYRGSFKQPLLFLWLGGMKYLHGYKPPEKGGGLSAYKNSGTQSKRLVVFLKIHKMIIFQQLSCSLSVRQSRLLFHKQDWIFTVLCVCDVTESLLFVFVLFAPASLAQLSMEDLGEPRPCPNLSLGKSGDCHSSAFFSPSPKEFTFHAQIVFVLSVEGIWKGYERGILVLGPWRMQAVVGEAAGLAAALLPSCEKGLSCKISFCLMLSEGSHQHCKETAAVSWSPGESAGAVWGV